MIWIREQEGEEEEKEGRRRGGGGEEEEEEDNYKRSVYKQPRRAVQRYVYSAPYLGINLPSWIEMT